MGAGGLAGMTELAQELRLPTRKLRGVHCLAAPAAFPPVFLALLLMPSLVLMPLSRAIKVEHA